MSAHAFDTSYGVRAASGCSSVYGRIDEAPYALSDDATTTAATLAARRHTSSSCHVPQMFVSKVSTGERTPSMAMAWAARWKTTSWPATARSNDAMSRTSPGRASTRPSHVAGRS